MFPTVDIIVKNLNNSTKKSEKFIAEKNSVDFTIEQTIEKSNWLLLEKIENSNGTFTICFISNEKYRKSSEIFYRGKNIRRQIWDKKREERLKKFNLYIFNKQINKGNSNAIG